MMIGKYLIYIGGQTDSPNSLTIGKKYLIEDYGHLKLSKDDIYEWVVIEAEDGFHWEVDMKNFKTIETIREEKLNIILNE